MLVDSASTGHNRGSDLISGLQNRMVDYKELDETHKIANVGHHALEGIGTGTISGGVTNQDGNEHHTEFSGTIVPGLGQCLFTVPAAASMGAVAVFDAAKPRLKIGTVSTPLQQLGNTNQLYFFSRRLDNKKIIRHIQGPADGDL